MKNIFTAISIFLIVALPMLGQEKGVETKSGDIRPVNEISVSYGVISIPSIANVLAGVFGTAFTGGMAKADKISSTGAISIEYMNYLNSHIAVGGAIVEENTSIIFDSYSGKDEDGNTEYKEGEEQHYNFLTVMPVVKLPWFYREHFSMYSKLAAGLCVGTSNGDLSFGAQVSPVGMDFGGKAIRGFAELGIGMQGMILGGLRWSF